MTAGELREMLRDYANEDEVMLLSPGGRMITILGCHPNEGRIWLDVCWEHQTAREQERSELERLIAERHNITNKIANLNPNSANYQKIKKHTRRVENDGVKQDKEGRWIVGYNIIPCIGRGRPRKEPIYLDTLPAEEQEKWNEQIKTLKK